MKSLSSYINEKLVINQRFDEKLIINKNFKNFRKDDDALNTVLQNVWDEISSNNKYDCNKIDAASVFKKASDVSYDHDYTASDIRDALDVTRFFKKCKTIYMLDSRQDTVIIDNIFLTLGSKQITLDELEYNDLNSYSFEYRKTDDFIILSCGGDNYYYVFIGKFN